MSVLCCVCRVEETTDDVAAFGAAAAAIDDLRKTTEKVDSPCYFAYIICVCVRVMSPHARTTHQTQREKEAIREQNGPALPIQFDSEKTWARADDDNKEEEEIDPRNKVLPSAFPELGAEAPAPAVDRCVCFAVHTAGCSVSHTHTRTGLARPMTASTVRRGIRARQSRRVLEGTCFMCALIPRVSLCVTRDRLVSICSALSSVDSVLRCRVRPPSPTPMPTARPVLVGERQVGRGDNCDSLILLRKTHSQGPTRLW